MSGCKAPEPKLVAPQKVIAMQVGNVRGQASRTFPGQASAEHESNLSFRVSGQLESRPAKVGDRVKAGQTLARLDQRDFVNRLNEAKGNLARAEAAQFDAKAKLERAKGAHKRMAGAISEQALDTAEANWLASKATVVAARSTVALAQAQLDYTVIQAPFDGEVVATYAEEFETLVAKQPILRLVNRDTIEFKVDVPESLIGHVDRVEQIMVNFDVKPGITFPAKLKKVGREATVGTRTYPVTLQLENTQDFDLLPGMAGNASLKVNLNPADNPEFEVPATSLFTDASGSESFVWVLQNDQLQKRSVELGLPSADGARIKKGVRSGEWIVTAGVHSLDEGQSVVAVERTAK